MLSNEQLKEEVIKLKYAFQKNSMLRFQDLHRMLDLIQSASDPDISDATTQFKGVVKLAGDLSGTADIPTVPGLLLKENSSNKQNNLTHDGTGTRFPTVDAINAALASLTVADATSTTKGVIKLAGDLSGTADSPTVPALSGKENLSNKENSVLDNSNTKYPTNHLVKTYVDSTISGAIIIQGDWNAATNTPNISGTTNTGYAWRVAVAGNTNLGGITVWAVNDLAVKTATGWTKIDNQNLAAVWGNITGSLSAQTDLQNALNLKLDKNTPISASTKAKITYDVNGLITSATDLPHNEVTSIQGGSPGEYYHLNSSQLNRVLNLIYVNSVNSATMLTGILEKGVSNSVSVRYNMSSNDDTFTAATLTGVGSVLSRVNTGNNDVIVGSYLASTTFILSMTYLRNGVSTNETKTATYTAVPPKWSNVSSIPVLDTYALCSTNLGSKILTTTTAMNNTGSATGQYIWFITTSSNSTITDGNNFNQSIGALNTADGASEFYKNSFVMTLQDSTTVTMYSYRTRTLKTFTGNIYKIT